MVCTVQIHLSPSLPPDNIQVVIISLVPLSNCTSKHHHLPTRSIDGLRVSLWNTFFSVCFRRPWLMSSGDVTSEGRHGTWYIEALSLSLSFAVCVYVCIFWCVRACVCVCVCVIE